MKLFPFFLLFFLISCNDNGNKPVNGPQPPGTIGYSIISTYPHDTSFYTQGLVIYKGNLYEGTGLEKRSKLMQVDLKSGNVIRKIDLEPQYFGEGVTILDDTVYQLTYKNNKVFAYTLGDFRKVKEFRLDHEGWGLTTDGKHLIASNGGSDLYYYLPSDFSLVKTQTVTEAGSPSFNVNELEFINGFIYANQYELPYILKINPATGEVVAKIDLTDVWDRVKAKNPKIDVPNGIAYDSATKKMYITGKLWPELYEIQLSQ
jgi:glutamine cyclotransferase